MKEKQEQTNKQAKKNVEKFLEFVKKEEEKYKQFQKDFDKFLKGEKETISID